MVSVILTLNRPINCGMFLSPSHRIFREFLCLLCLFRNQNVIPFAMVDIMELLLALMGMRSSLPGPACTSSGSERDFAELCMGWPVTPT